MKQTNKSFESLYIHDYTQFRAISESFFYWIKLSFCIALEQQRVCSLVFLVFRKYQLWIALRMFLKLCLISGSCSYCVVLIKESLLHAFNKWTNKAVETPK